MRPGWRAARVAESRSGTPSSARLMPASARRIFPSESMVGRKSATAAAITTRSAFGSSRSMTCSRSREVRNRSIRTCVSSRSPAGTSVLIGPRARTTDIPLARSADAIARPICPDERFPRNRTESTGSSVGPAVTRAIPEARCDGTRAGAASVGRGVGRSVFIRGAGLKPSSRGCVGSCGEGTEKRYYETPHAADRLRNSEI